MLPKAGQHEPVDLKCALKKGSETRERNLDLPLDPAMSAPARIDAPGQLAGRPLEEWNGAYSKVESYFHALRVRNKVLLGQLVALVLERAMQRSAAEPQRSATELAVEEMDHLVNEWFAQVLQAPPAGAEMLSTRGRMALLLADMPGRWQDQFLRPGPWPDEFVRAMRDGYLRAGPDFQLAKMTPRPLDLGPIATLTHWSRLPYVKMAASWILFGLLLVAAFLCDPPLMPSAPPISNAAAGQAPPLVHVANAPGATAAGAFFYFTLPRVLLTGLVSMLFADLLWRTGWSSSGIVLLCLFIVFFLLIAHGLHARCVWICPATDPRPAPDSPGGLSLAQHQRRQHRAGFSHPQ